MSAYQFSGPGDIDRSADSGEPEGVSTSATNAESTKMNAYAADTVSDIPEFGRALSGPSVGDDDMGNHVYGES